MELIDRDNLFELFKDNQYFRTRTVATIAAKNVIDSAPTIDAEPVRHGHWIDAYPDIEPNPMFMYGICSECGFEQGLSNKLHYCPNCGAKMDEVKE